YLGAAQCGNADVLDEIAVIANQHADAKALGQIENGVVRPAANAGVLEGLQLAVTMHRAVAERDDITVVKHASPARFDQSRSQRDAVAARQIAQSPRARTIRDGFGERRQLFERKIADEPIARNATFRKNDQSHALSSRLF